jgi:phosphatidyl-myo-inositol dimannoside synthase
MRNLLVTEVFPPTTGGSGRWLWELYRRLPHDDLIVAAGEHPGQYEFDQTHDLTIARMQLRFSSWGLLGMRSFRQYHRAYRTLKQLVREHGVAVVHCGRCLPEGLLAWFLRARIGLPYLCYVHGEELSIAAGSRELRWWAGRVLRGAEMVIANSKNTADLLRDQWAVCGSRLHVLNPGVDTDYFCPANRTNEARASLGWHDRRVVLTVGRLQKRKGHDMLIRALPVIRRTVPDVLYAVVGDGEERPALEELIAQLGLHSHVQILGQVPDAIARICYQQSDLFVLPNRRVGDDFEGFGMVLLEAQACGKPVVAGDSGGTAETMRVGETGFIVPCDGPEKLAGLLGEMLTNSDRLADMGQRARDWVVQNFDWDVLCRQAARLFDRSGRTPAPASAASHG